MNAAPARWRDPIRIVDAFGATTIVYVVPGTANRGAQIAVSHTCGSTHLSGLTPDVCDELARRLIAAADRMRRIAAEDQRIRDAIAADEIGDAP